MRGIIVFEDNLINDIDYRFEVNLDNGKVSILNYFKDKNEYLELGFYKNFNELPNDTLLYDLKNIPEINKFHEWVLFKYNEKLTFLNIKDLIIKDISKTNDIDLLLKILEKHSNRIYIENREDYIDFD